MAAIFVTDGEPIKKVFDRRNADALQICGALWPDALQVLAWRLEVISHSLHNDRLPAIELDLTNACGQREWLFDRDATRLVRRLRVVADDFLQHPTRNGNPGYRDRFDAECGDAILRAKNAVYQQRQRPAHEIPRIEHAS